MNDQLENTYQQLGTKEDLREFSRESAADREDLYNSMLNIILTHKNELQKIPQCSALSTASDWATKRGMRTDEVDLDHDGHPETVVFNKAGRPYIINGYKLTASDYPIRREYWASHRTAQERAGEPMRQWVQDKAYDVVPNPENKWENKSVSKSDFGRALKEWGYKMPAKPKKQLTPYAIFSKLIAPYVKAFFDTDNETQLAKLQSSFDSGFGPACVDVIRKIASPISMYRYLYIKIVLLTYYFQLCHDRNEGRQIQLSEFKKYMKDNSKRFYNYFCNGFLNGTQKESFRPSRVSQEIVNDAMIHGQINIDESDAEDGLCYLLGGKANWADDKTVAVETGENRWLFREVILNNDAAADFLKALSYKGSDRTFQQITVRSKKALELFKKRAQEKTKEYFKTIQEHMYNEDRYNRFLQGSALGLPTVSTEQGYQEHVAAGNPQSPVRNATPLENTRADAAAPK